jgi:hypothetical protein
MENHEDDNGMENDPRAVYGAHQEYDDDGNYPQSHYAISAAMEPDQYGDEEDDQDSETYAS